MVFLPNFRHATFTPGAPINNSYFPLHPGWVLTYTGTDQQGGPPQYDDMFVTNLTRVLDGVRTMVVRDTVYEDGHLSEDTLDYYAQDTQGNVWYLGETVINYEFNDKGKFVGINTDGGWLAGVDGAKPGWILPAHPTAGLSFYQEFSPGVAVDQSYIGGLNVHVQANGQEYTTLKSVETSALEPGVTDIKYYASGIGVLREDADIGANGVPALVNELTLVQQGRSVGHIPPGTEAAQKGDFISNGHTEWVTIIPTNSDFENALGYYTFNPTTGVTGEGRIIFDGTKNAPAETISLHVPDGMGIGFFLVPDVTDLGVNLSNFDQGGLFFENMLTGHAASLSDGMAPVVTDKHGNPLPIEIFHALGATNGSDLLNPGIGLEAVEWGQGNNGVVLGFEDHRVTEQGYDGDFNDLLMVFGNAPVDPSVFLDSTLHDHLI